MKKLKLVTSRPPYPSGQTARGWSSQIEFLDWAPIPDVILISIHKRHCDGIFAEPGTDNKKILELRLRSLPTPCLAFVYECGPDGSRKVIGMFTSLYATILKSQEINTPRAYGIAKQAMLSIAELRQYLKGRDGHISIIQEARRFEHPISLAEMPVIKPIICPPQSWQYITLKNNNHDSESETRD